MATGTPRTPSLATPVRFRRNVARLTADQLRLLRDGFSAMMRLTDDRGYQRWAGIHGLPLPISCANAHGTPLFLPWHRAYLYRFERALRDQVPQAMLAWWDWRTPAGQRGRIPAALAESTVGGQPNPLSSARVSQLALDEGRRAGVNVAPQTQRRPSTDLPLPTPEEIEGLVSIRHFGTFSDRLDSIHGTIHMWVGGHMSRIPFAAYDPIFWAHHAMVDRLWRIWQVRHGRPGPPESIFNTALEPFGMTVRQTLSTSSLGYDYSALTTSTAGVRSNP